MKISFVIPAYNEEDNITNCITAIKKEIEQNLDIESEIIVVNNASTDKTKEIVLGFRNIILVDEPKKGIVWARSAGLKSASGDLIANIDADVILLKNWLYTVKKKFTEDEKLLALSGPHVYQDAPLLTRFATKIWYLVGYIFDRIGGLFGKSSMIQGGNYIVRREAFEKIGGFDTTIAFWGEDVDIGKRLNRIGKVLWTFSLPVYASSRRIRSDGILNTGFKYAANYFSVTFLGKPFSHDYKDIR